MAEEEAKAHFRQLTGREDGDYALLASHVPALRCDAFGNHHADAVLCCSIQGSSVVPLSLNSAAQARPLPADTEYPTFAAIIDADISPLQIRLKSMRFPASPLAWGYTAWPRCANPH